MSDYTITDAVASFNIDSPAKVPENGAVNIDVDLTYAGTIAVPINITAEATSTRADVIEWTQVATATITDLGSEPFRFTVTALASTVLQPVDKVNQNYLVTVTDNDSRTQIFNIALDNTEGYCSATLDVIDGYPSPAGTNTIAGPPTWDTATPFSQDSSTQITIDWNAPANDGGSSITGYKIERAVSKVGTFTAIVLNTGNTLTTYTDSGLTAYTNYSYKVYALTAVGTGAASDPSDTVPAAPTSLTATAVSNSQIDLAWTAPTLEGGSSVTGYKIERESPEGGGFAVIVADTGSTTTTYNNGGLAAATEYNYRVSAISALGTGLPSNEAKDTTDP
jgi:hypothetical protein